MMTTGIDRINTLSLFPVHPEHPCSELILKAGRNVLVVLSFNMYPFNVLSDLTPSASLKVRFANFSPFPQREGG